MKRSDTLHISDVFRQLLDQEPDFHEHLLEQKALSLLPSLLGSAYRYVAGVSLCDAVLTFTVHSASARQVIAQQRESLRQNLNRLVEAELIREVRVF